MELLQNSLRRNFQARMAEAVSAAVFITLIAASGPLCASCRAARGAHGVRPGLAPTRLRLRNAGCDNPFRAKNGCLHE